MIDLGYELTELYERWLLEHHCDEIRHKEELIDMVENGFNHDVFVDEVKRTIE